jgi:hypothetical protein
LYDEAGSSRGGIVWSFVHVSTLCGLSDWHDKHGKLKTTCEQQVARKKHFVLILSHFTEVEHEAV